MTTESSAVFVAVRVRPFGPKEDPLSCTITVPDSKTITLTDVPALFMNNNSGSSGSPPSGANNSGWGNSGASLLSQVGGGYTNIPIEHSFSFDKIFWSVPADVLPLSVSGISGERGNFSLLSSHTAFSRMASTSQDPAESSLGFPLSRPPNDGLSVSSPVDTGYLSSTASTTTGRNRYAASISSALPPKLPCLASAPAYDSQESVYDFIGPRLYEAIMKGFNACLFAYGQTGSGKSYSMIGDTEVFSGSAMSVSKKRQPLLGSASNPEEGYGIIPRLSTDLFRCMREERERDEAVSYTVELSFLEIYCEKVRDLLVGRGGVSSNQGNSSSSTGSLRIRQHPINGPYVEGLSQIRVRDADSVIKNLASGMRDRVTAETKMNEHSSRSHAILQLKITKVTAVSNEAGVVPKTCVCKASLVDLAGSERVSQSGVVGTRFEETRNINLSLSCLGRIIQQLSDKQSGKHVIPAYRESALTWLLSDSLGGNSKTILLATVAPSAYCHAQTLNTLRFAGVAKRIINVASVNEDQHLEKLVLDLRRQIVRLTLQLETGKAAEVHIAEIESLRAERDELRIENKALKAKETTKVDNSVMQLLRKRVAELEEENGKLRGEKVELEQRFLTSTSSLREELSKSRAELLSVKSAYEKEINQPAKHPSTQQQPTDSGGIMLVSGLAIRSKGKGTAGPGSTTSADSAPFLDPKQLKLTEDVSRLTKQVRALERSLKAAQHSASEAKASAKAAREECDSYRVRYDESKRQLASLHERMQSTTSLLETTQCELAAVKGVLPPAAAGAQKNTQDNAASLASQLSSTREDYLNEKQNNVQLLLRASLLEKERNDYRNLAREKYADINELELMLLEETESSERYYLRMRFHRAMSELQQSFARKLCFDGMVAAGIYQKKGRQSNDFSPSCFPASLPRYSVKEIRGYTSHGVTPRSTLTSLNQSEGVLTELAIPNQQGLHSSLELLNTQQKYECLFDESQHRDQIEQEYFKSIIGLLLQQSRLQRDQVLHQSELLTEVRAQLALESDDTTFIKQRFKERNEALAESRERQAAAEEALRLSEAENMRLSIKLKAADDRAADLEESFNTVVEKLASLQSAYSSMEERCHLAMKAAAEAQGEVLSDSEGNLSNASKEGLSTGSSCVAKDGSHTGDLKRYTEEEEIVLVPNAESLHKAVSDSGPLRGLLQKELQAALEKNKLLESQVEQLHTELGVVHAKEERTANLHAEYREHQQLEQDLLRKQIENLNRSNTYLLSEIDTVVRDCNQRVEQQQAIVAMLRDALNEETSTADRRQETVHVLENKLRTMQDNYTALTDRNTEVELSYRSLEVRYGHLQRELNKLQGQYSEVRDQLLEMGNRVPELYVLLERGISEDTAAWLEKIKREKANLERQKKDAQNLRKELLEHVRIRNSNLQDVQRQLEEIVETSAFTNAEVLSTVAYGVEGSQATDVTNLTMSEVSNIRTETSLTSMDV
ncbi:unnamed protein product [Phytomonas sp. EM1]|nr:unnamed protein product [Phytomonas sp. EM1]|eukprot:CCW61950.1 unnamed protein product [Phytomonas sp. isolate EM1]